MKSSTLLIGAALTGVLFSSAVMAKEYPIGGPVQHDGMKISSAYLLNIETSPARASMVMGKDVVHLETDVHATKGNRWGFSDGEWIPYLSVDYVVQKQGDSNFLEFGQLLPMSAGDGAHYAHSVKMGGAGTYKVTLKYVAPDEQGYARHVDKATGIPDWFAPFTETFTFKYPQ